MSKIKNFFTKPLNIILILTIIFVIVGVYIFYGQNKKSSPEYVTAEIGEIVQKVSVTGRVKPSQSVELAFEKSGKVAAITVRAGDRVTADQILASLDNAELIAQLSQAEANWLKEKIKLEQLKLGTRQEDIQISETKVFNAQKSLTDAQNNLVSVKNKAAVDLANRYDKVDDILSDAYIKADDAINKQIDELFANDNTTNPQLTFYTAAQIETDAEARRILAGKELTQLKSAIDNLSSAPDKLEAALTQAKSHLIFIDGFLNILSEAVNNATGLSQATATNYKYYINTGRTNLVTAISNLDSEVQAIAAQKALNQSNVISAENSVNAAKSALASAQDELNLKKAGYSDEEIAAQEAQVKYALANVQNYQAQLAKTIIRAPLGGIITKQDAKVGGIVSAGAPLISLISAARFEIEANISENEIAKVNSGDKVEMTLDALGPAEKFSGKIIKIDPAETIVSGVIYYKVTSVFDAEDERIKSGMTVNLDIQTDKKEGVLYLPYYLVREKNGSKYVQVLENEKIIEKIVETGLEGETMIEIVKGLTTDEKVVVPK